MYSHVLCRSYLPLLRTVKKTFRGDIAGERQVVAAIRTSIAELVNSRLPDADIVREMELTEKMLITNIAQVEYNEKIDSYSVKLTEEMIPENGSVVDIKTPADLVHAEQLDFDSFVSHHKQT
jgi:hypothetical protein